MSVKPQRLIRLSGASPSGSVRLVVLIAGIALLVIGVVSGLRDSRHTSNTSLDQTLETAAAEEAQSLSAYFERARAVDLLLAHNPAVVELFSGATDPATLKQVNEALDYLERLYPDRIGEACVIASNGVELARVVNREVAAPEDLSPDESGNPFFHPTFALAHGEVFQAKPYVSPDTNEWVISNSTLVPTPDGQKRGIAHFEVTVESFRKSAKQIKANFAMLVVEAESGRIIVDSRIPQRVGVPLGRPPDKTTEFVRSGDEAGVFASNGRRFSYRRIPNASTNANDWYAVATASEPAAVGLRLDWGTVTELLAALALIAYAGASMHLVDRLKLSAATDSLTGLPNRRALDDVEARVSAGEVGAVLLVDLDHFKDVNDSFGHDTGDRLLRELADRMSKALRRTDALVRLGGDEFAVVLSNPVEATAAVSVGHKLVRVIEQAQVIDGEDVLVSASVGVAVHPDHGTTGEKLFQSADTAMYHAKREHLSVALHSGEERATTPTLVLLGELRRAIDDRLLTTHYQPQIELATGRLSAVEALVRWPHETRGMMLPGDFLPLAEERGLMPEISKVVMEGALTHLRRWSDDGWGFGVSINLSADDLTLETITHLEELLKQYEVTPSSVCIELTEGTFLSDRAGAIELLSRLREQGVEVAIDDFGAGYSSLSYLRNLPVDQLKIDRAFISQLVGSNTDRAIVRGTVALAHDLGLTVVAEGVEDEATIDVLAELGCDRAQGFFICRPVRSDELLAWVEHRAGMARTQQHS